MPGYYRSSLAALGHRGLEWDPIPLGDEQEQPRHPALKGRSSTAGVHDRKLAPAKQQRSRSLTSAL
jgi:hypothetical protein